MFKNRLICILWISLIVLVVVAMITYIALADKYKFYSPKTSETVTAVATIEEPLCY